jgi:hypothetical protein
MLEAAFTTLNAALIGLLCQCKKDEKQPLKQYF